MDENELFCGLRSDWLPQGSQGLDGVPGSDGDPGEDVSSAVRLLLLLWCLLTLSVSTGAPGSPGPDGGAGSAGRQGNSRHCSSHSGQQRAVAAHTAQHSTTRVIIWNLNRLPIGPHTKSD